MIDAERMLGSLVRNALSGGRRSRRRRRRGRSSMLSMGTKGALGLGALGVAIAAFEHFTQDKPATATHGAGGPPPPPPSAATADLPPLPHPPGGAPAVAPSPPPPPPAAQAQQEALLLVRAMIAAANADHELDDEERARILRALDESGLGEEERQFLLTELERPMDVATLAERATTPELARQIYLASLMAIEVDTRGEENYLARLAQSLGLDAAQVDEIESMLGGAPTAGGS